MIIYSREKQQLIIPTGLGNGDNRIPYDEGYEEGLTIGKAEGLEEGYNNGYAIGHDNGYDEGYGEGHNTGFAAGKENGYGSGYTAGYGEGQSDGYADGYNSGFESGHTIGYDEGEESGYAFGVQTQKDKLVGLDVNANGHYEREDGYNVVNVNIPFPLEDRDINLNSSFSGVAEYYPHNGYSGMSKVIVSDNGYGQAKYKQGREDGYDEGWPLGYQSGFTDGQNYKSLRIDGFSEVPSIHTHQGVWSVYEYGFNGIMRVPTIDDDDNGREYEYRDGNDYHFGVSGIMQSIEVINTLDLHLAFNYSEEERITPSAYDLNLTINEEPITIISATKEMAYSAETGYQPRIIYHYHYKIRPFYPTEFGLGWEDGYSSGYTNGYADGISSFDELYSVAWCTERTWDGQPITLTPADNFASTAAGFSSITISDCGYGQKRYEEGLADGLASGGTSAVLQEKSVNINIYDSGWNGTMLVTPDEGYDGISALTVTAVDYNTNQQNFLNSMNVVANSIVNQSSESAVTLNINRNGTYYASGSTTYSTDNPNYPFDVQVPTLIKEINVNVSSNLFVSGTVHFNVDYDFNPADENGVFFALYPAIQAGQNIIFDDGPLIGTVMSGRHMESGSDHTFVVNYGKMALAIPQVARSGYRANTFGTYETEIDGVITEHPVATITYSNVYQEINNNQ